MKDVSQEWTEKVELLGELNGDTTRVSSGMAHFRSADLSEISTSSISLSAGGTLYSSNSAEVTTIRTA